MGNKINYFHALNAKVTCQPEYHTSNMSHCQYELATISRGKATYIKILAQQNHLLFFDQLRTLVNEMEQLKEYIRRGGSREKIGSSKIPGGRFEVHHQKILNKNRVQSIIIAFINHQDTQTKLVNFWEGQHRAGGLGVHPEKNLED